MNAVGHDTTVGTLCEAVPQMVLNCLQLSTIPLISSEDSGSLCSPRAEPADEGVEGWREQQTEGGDAEHPEEYGGSEGLPHLRACPGRHNQREDAEDESEGGHQDGAEPGPGSGCRSLLAFITILVLPLPCELHDENGVLRRQADQNHKADLGQDVDRHASKVQTGRR